MVKYLWVFILICIMGYFGALAEYQAVKHYHPDLTMVEYFLLIDKIFITPPG